MSDLNNINDATIYTDDEFRIPAVIKVIGVGGGGGNAVNYLHSQGIDKITFMACNTDKMALSGLDVPTRLVLGDPASPDYGLGAGDNPDKGRAAAEFSADDIRQALQDDTNMVFVTAGMGGGTGTGGGPVVARIAKEAGMLTIGIVTIPFFFEGERKIIKALKGAEEMRQYVDSLLIINNERLTEIYKDLNLTNAFSKADDTLADATRSIADIIYRLGYINVDFNDVRTTLKDSSTAIISTGYGEGERRVTKAIQDALDSPLLRNSDIRSSKRLLFYLYFNPDAENVISMAEMNEITQFSNNLSKNIGIKWGACWDRTLGEAVKITVLASGFDISITKDGQDQITFRADGEGADDTPLSSSAPAPAKAEGGDDSIKQRIKDEYGEGKMTAHNQEMARAKYVVLKPAQFDDDDVIALFDKIAAYARTPAQTEELRGAGTPAPRPQPRQATLPGTDQGPEPDLDRETTHISFF